VQGAACLGVPASELVDLSVSLDALLPGARGRELTERFTQARDVNEALHATQSWLLGLPYVPDRLVERALVLLEATTNDAQVSAVARALELSERQLERRLLARTGFTPKRYARLRRFERAVASLESASTLAQVAADAGYYDQSHFSREFTRFAGTTPGRFLRHLR
jgi:AraC-like DNA-binding protein